MPTYQIDRPGPTNAAGDAWADMAKQFMSSPAYAGEYMSKLQFPQGVRGKTPPALPGLDPTLFSDRDLLAGILTAEGAGLEDMGYIANVIHNRAASGAYPGSYRDVILQPGQFSALNAVTGYAGGEGANDLWRRPTGDAYTLADLLIAGNLPDQTGGALNYYNPSIANPAWGGPGFSFLPGSQHVFGTAG